MTKERRRIIWHCATGHDFEVEDELRRTVCPVCGGSDVERVRTEKEKERSKRGSSRSWFWR